MSTKTAKPVTAYAKEDAKLTADNRKVHPKYDDDVNRYGRRVADFNAGWLKADTMHRRKQKQRAR